MDCLDDIESHEQRAELERLAADVAHYYIQLRAGGVPKRAALALTARFQDVALLPECGEDHHGAD